MQQPTQNVISYQEYKRQLEEAMSEVERLNDIRLARQRATTQTAPRPRIRSTTTLVTRTRSERRFTTRRGQTADYTVVREEPSPPRPRASAPLIEEAAEFFNSWLMENPNASPSTESWERCLCAAVISATRDRLVQPNEFVEDVRFFYGCWEREVELENHWDRRQ